MHNKMHFRQYCSVLQRAPSFDWKDLTYNNRNRICNNRICNDLIRIARENNFILDIVLKNIYNKSIDEKIKKIEMECSEIIDRERKIEQLKNERRALFELV